GEIDQAVAELLARAGADDEHERRRARGQIADLARPLAVQLGDPIQAELDDRGPVSDEALERVLTWWRAVDASWLLDESAAWQTEQAARLRERRHYFQIADFATGIIQSDLFLTGDSGE
ncbi:MAG: hypothetical protein KKI02_09670, partial [Planctomycetes bacterium]|nr:hypothetical protein [Planctomycetota bacterium]